MPTAAPLVLSHAAPEQHGVPSATLGRLVEQLSAAGLDPHALLVARRGEVLLECSWAPYRPTEPALVYSVSKTFTSLAIGLLEAEGRLRPEDPVDRHLAVPNPAGVTVRDLLTMATGHSREQTLTLPFSVETLLTTPAEHPRGTHFAYSSPATYALSALVTAITGDSLTEYLRPRLLDPIGVPERWWRRHDGLDQGFSGLHLTVEDIARVATLLAQGGAVEDRQVVPAGYVEALSRAWVDTSEPGSPADEAPAGDWSLGYGYQVWRSRHGFRLDGAYGQFGLVLPERDLVIAYQGSTTDTGRTLELFWELVDQVTDAPLAVDKAETDRLDQSVASLDSWDARAVITPDPAAAPLDTTGWRIRDLPDGWLLRLPSSRPGEHWEIPVGRERWSSGILPAGEEALPVAARGEDDGADLLIHLVVTSSPHRLLVTRTAAGLTARWHTAPLWRPELATLLVPAAFAPQLPPS